MNRKARIFSTFVVLILLLGLWQSAASAVLLAATIYVRPGGDDTLCDGTVDVDYEASIAPACAVQTIQQGINLVDAGGTVYVVTGHTL